MTAWSVVSRTFSTWGSNVLNFALFTIAVFAPVVLVLFLMGMQALLSYQPGRQLPPGMLKAFVFLGVPLVLLAFLVDMCGVTYGAVQHLAGQAVRLGSMVSIAFRRIGPLLLLGLLIFVAAIAVGLALAMLGVVLGLLFGVFGIFLLRFAFFVSAAVVGTGLSVTLPVMLAEGLGPIPSLQRSWALTRDRRLSIFLGAFALAVVAYAIHLGVGKLAEIGTAGQVVGAVVQLVVLPLTTVLPAVAYSELRTEKEGVSTVELAKVFE